MRFFSFSYSHLSSYPTSILPPIDWHTATYFHDGPARKDYIIIIGGLGYTDAESRNHTNVYRLDLDDYSIERVETSGACSKGGMHEHDAELGIARKEAVIFVTTKEGKKWWLRLRDMEWYGYGQGS